MSDHGKDGRLPISLVNSVKAWERISTDKWLLNTVQGVRILFVEVPQQEREPRPYKLSEEESEFVDTELVRMVAQGVIEKATELEDQVVSNVFLRPKKDGKYRMILDLTWVNTYVEYEHFKMDLLQTALDMMRPDCWMASIDLKEAYYAVPVAEVHRKFLRFRWGGELYQFRVLPNGLACAPRIFTKILNLIFAYLREQGVEAFQYIDDSFSGKGRGISESVESNFGKSWVHSPSREVGV